MLDRAWLQFMTLLSVRSVTVNVHRRGSRRLLTFLFLSHSTSVIKRCSIRHNPYQSASRSDHSSITSHHQHHHDFPRRPRVLLAPRDLLPHCRRRPRALGEEVRARDVCRRRLHRLLRHLRHRVHAGVLIDLGDFTSMY
jgi:hypothetical protein